MVREEKRVEKRVEKEAEGVERGEDTTCWEERIWRREDRKVRVVVVWRRAVLYV